MCIPDTIMIKLQTSFSDLDEVLTIAKKKRSLIKIIKKFNNKEIYDDKRLMAHFSINKSSSEAVKKLAKELSTYLKIIMSNGIMQALYILLSVEGGEDQLVHGDFDENTIKKILARGLKYWSTVVGLMDETYLNIKGYGKIHIPKGFVLFFDHTVLHGGCGYEKENFRLFFKVGYEKKEFPFNKGGDLQIARKCKFCGKLKMTRPAYNSHVLICKENLKGAENREKKNKPRRKGEKEKEKAEEGLKMEESDSSSELDK